MEIQNLNMMVDSLKASLAEAETTKNTLNSELEILRSQPQQVKEIIVEKIVEVEVEAEAKFEPTDIEPQIVLDVVEVETTTPVPVTKPMPEPEKKSYNWTLKSARKGEVILSDRASGTLQRVRVGDKIPGLGTISAISQENGRWVVRGSQKVIFQ